MPPDPIDHLRTEINTQLSEMRSDLRELTRAMKELVRIDSNICALREALGRIGEEVRDHEKRLREAEQKAAAAAADNGNTSKLTWWLLTAAMSALSVAVTYVMRGPR